MQFASTAHHVLKFFLAVFIIIANSNNDIELLHKESLLIKDYLLTLLEY